MTRSPYPDLPRLLESFFSDRLMRQRQASPHTIASYRDTFRLLLEFVQPRLKKAPSALSIEDLDAPLLGAFLDHLEEERHSFFKYAALHQPAQSGMIQRVLAIPSKRYDRGPIEFLTRNEIEALLAAPDQNAWIGRRDRALILLAAQAGLRVSELVGLRCQDLSLGRGAHVRCQGKGRKERCTPLRKDAARVLRAWSREHEGRPGDPLFPNVRGGHLSRDAVEHLLAKHAASARRRCPSLRQKRVSPHSLRHAAAMDLLQHGVDPSVIALWLGHESVETTQIYIHANMALKEAAIARTTPSKVRAGRYRPGDRLLAFLKSL